MAVEGSDDISEMVAKDTFTREYHLPDSFLSDNVTTALEAASANPKLRFSRGRRPEDFQHGSTETRGSSESEQEDASNHGWDDGWQGFYVSRDAYEEVREEIQSTLASTQNPDERPAIALCSGLEGSTEFFKELTLSLAKVLVANLIYLDMDAFEELAMEFEDQDQPTQGMSSEDADAPGAGVVPEPLQHYFAMKKESKASKEVWARHEEVYKTILAASAEKTNRGLSTETESSNHPLLLHVHHTERYIKVPVATGGVRYLEDQAEHRKFWGRLRDAILRLRKSGTFSVLVLTSSIAKNELTWCSPVDCRFSTGQLGSRYKKLGTDAGAVTQLDPSYITKSLQKRVGFGRENCLEKANLRRLIRRIRLRLAHQETRALSLHHLEAPGCHEQDRADCLEILSKRAWREDHIARAAHQVLKRYHHQSSVDMNDVCVVLARMARLEREGEEQEAERLENQRQKRVQRSAEQELARRLQEEKLKAEERKALILEKTKGIDNPWELRIKEIEDDCDEFEAQLLASVVKPDKLETKYDQVILNDDVKEVIRFLMSLWALRGRIKAGSDFLTSQMHIKGAMLYGPPGTGKTQLARAIANGTNSFFLAVDPSVITSKYVGETEKYIKAVFSLAKKLSPCIVFIDEVDSLFRRRSGDDRRYERAAVSQFLSEMDGLSQMQDGQQPPFVLVATNRPMDLDDAFHRRLPQKCYLGLPSQESRAQILRLFLKEEDLDQSVDIDTLAARTGGYTGSDLRSVCSQAALFWAMQQNIAMPAALTASKDNQDDPFGDLRVQITNAHFTQALQKIRPSVTAKVLKELENYRNSHGGQPPQVDNMLDEQNQNGMPVNTNGSTTNANGTAAYPNRATTYPDGKAPYLNGTTSRPNGNTTNPRRTKTTSKQDMPVLPIIQPPPDCMSKVHQSISYAPLPNSTSMRVLKLYGLENKDDMFEPIRCSMIACDLDKGPEYVALSYTWGDPLGLYDSDNAMPPEHWAAPAFEIECNGKVASVATNLYTALIAIRYQYSNSNDGESKPPNRGRTSLQERIQSRRVGQDRVFGKVIGTALGRDNIPEDEDDAPGLHIWIDALCINQSDLVERGQQVTMMDRIYASAKATIMWLGGEDSLATAAAQYFESTHTPANGKMALIDIRDPSTFAKAGIEPISEETFIGIAGLYSRQYFKRAWVVQEWVRSREVVMLCGLRSLDPHLLATQLIFIHDIGWWEQITQIIHVQALGQSSPGRLHEKLMQGKGVVYSRGSHDMPMSTMQCIMALKAHLGSLDDLDRLLLGLEGFKTSQIPGSFDLGLPDMEPLCDRSDAFYTFQSFRASVATDPRDKVFAFLGILKEFPRHEMDLTTIKPDYTTPVQQVYTDVAKLMISGSVGLKWLALKEAKPNIDGLPSWVPDMSILHTTLMDGAVQFTASRALNPCKVSFKANGVLCASGSMSDIVVATYEIDNFLDFTGLPQVLSFIPEHSQILQPRIGPSKLRFWWDVYSSKGNGIRDNPDPAHMLQSTQDRYEVLWRTLLMDQWGDSYPAEASKSSALLGYLKSQMQIRLIRIIIEDLINHMPPNDDENLSEIAKDLPGEPDRDSAAMKLAGLNTCLLQITGQLPFGDEVVIAPEAWNDYETLYDTTWNNPDGIEEHNVHIYTDECGKILREWNTMKRDQSTRWLNNWYSGKYLFATASGKLGLSHATVVEGDEIWLLPGVDVPMMMRCAEEPNQRSVVGEAYIHGLMHGSSELLDGVEDVEIV